jgi:protein ImuB
MRSRGPSRYYGGEEAAASALLSTARSLGLPDARVGIADGPFAAEHAARATQQTPILRVPPGGSARFLEPLPVSVLVEPRVATLLNRLGVRRLGEFAALPVADVLRRFGPEVALAHSRASASDGERVVARTPPPEFDQVLEFEPGLDRIDQLAFAFRNGAEEFVGRLTAAKLVCTGVRVELAAEDGSLSSRSWLHPRWFTAADVVDRVRWQLQGTGTADIGLSSPIVRLRVHPDRLDSTGNHEEGLWGSGPDERVHHGLTRVQSMLGHEGVLTAVIGGGRMLTERTVLVPWGDRPPDRVTGRPWPGSLPAPAPATVFRERMPAALLDGSGAPLSIDTRGAVSAAPETVSSPVIGGPHRVRAWAGPWPVVERWWDPEHGRQVHRFQLVDDDGCAWLLVCDGGDWWIEARYD